MMPAVVSCILMDTDKRILLLKRSSLVKTYKGLWGVAAGYVEEDELPYETAMKEIREETGLNEKEVSLVKQGAVVSFTDIDGGISYDWEVHPFLFAVKKNVSIQLSWEHTAYRWVPLSAMDQYTIVPRLVAIMLRLFSESS